MERPTVKTVLNNRMAQRVIIETGDNQFIEAALTEHRINREKETEGKFIYDIRHTDEDWCEPATIEDHVLVNWFGCLIVNQPLSFPEDDSYLTIANLSYKDE